MIWNDQRLKEEVLEVRECDKKLIDVDLLDTLKVDDCDFLAAPQIGILKRSLVINCRVLDDEKFNQPICLHNPCLSLGKNELQFFQKCDSVPNFSSYVKRFDECVIKGESAMGEVELEFLGKEAAELQKAYDFLSNKSILSRVSSLKKCMYLKRIAKNAMKRKRELESEDLKNQERKGFRKKRRKKK